MKVVLRIVIALSVIVAVAFIATVIAIENSGRRFLLSKIDRIPSGGYSVLLDIPPDNRTWEVMIALSKNDRHRLDQMDGSIEIEVRSSGTGKLIFAWIKNREFSSKILDVGESFVLFRGTIADFINNNSFYQFMDDEFYPHSKYESFMLLTAVFNKDRKITLTIKPSVDIVLEDPAFVFAYILKDSI